MSKNMDVESENLAMNKNGEYQINHRDTENRELGVTIVEAISKVSGKPISEINLDKNPLNISHPSSIIYPHILLKSF